MSLRFRAAAFLSLVLTVAVVTPAHGAVVGTLNTGTSLTTGAKLRNNTFDERYEVAPGGTGGFVGGPVIARSDPLPPPYLPDSASAGSRWIAIDSGQGLEGISVPIGTYNLKTEIDLTGFNPATALIPGGRFAVDDGLEGIQVNGVTVYTPPGGVIAGFDRLLDLPANLGAGAFRAGVNTVTFNLVNAVDGSPLAFRLEAAVTATPVPEPGAAGAALACVGLAPLARRRGVGPRRLRLAQ